MDEKLLDNLSKKDKEILATVWEYPGFETALKNLADLKNQKLAQLTHINAVSMEDVVRNRGTGQGVNWIHDIIKQIHKTHNKN